MAEKQDRKAEAPPPADPKHGGKKEKAAGGGLLGKMPVLLGGVMLIEAVVLFAGFKFLGGGEPRHAAGAELTHEEKSESGEKEKGEGGEKGGAPKIDNKKSVEIKLLQRKFVNRVNGRMTLYDVTIYVTTKGENKARVEQIITDREASISDRIRTIIAQNDPEKLGGGSEPDLVTLRRQVKYQLDEIIGEGMIDEVLVPICIPYRADF